MTKLTEGQIQKLPKWAQEAFNALQRERDTAVAELREWNDSQTKSPISIMEYVSTGEAQGPSRFDRYVQAEKLQINWQGVRLDIHLTEAGPSHENCIRLQWSGERALGGTQVAFVPTSFQSASLISKENMR